MPCNAVAKHNKTLRPHIEKQIYDAQIWQKTMFLTEHLIVLLRTEISVRSVIFLWMYR